MTGSFAFMSPTVLEFGTNLTCNVTTASWSRWYIKYQLFPRITCRQPVWAHVTKLHFRPINEATIATQLTCGNRKQAFIVFRELFDLRVTAINER